MAHQPVFQEEQLAVVHFLFPAYDSLGELLQCAYEIPMFLLVCSNASIVVEQEEAFLRLEMSEGVQLKLQEVLQRQLPAKLLTDLHLQCPVDVVEQPYEQFVLIIDRADMNAVVITPK